MELRKGMRVKELTKKVGQISRQGVVLGKHVVDQAGMFLPECDVPLPERYIGAYHQFRHARDVNFIRHSQVKCIQ